MHRLFLRLLFCVRVGGSVAMPRVCAGRAPQDQLERLTKKHAIRTFISTLYR